MCVIDWSNVLENTIRKGDNPVESIWFAFWESKTSLFFKESNSLRLEFKMASRQLLILNIESKTDSRQVLWRKAEKNFEKRVKKNWNFDRFEI